MVDAFLLAAVSVFFIAASTLLFLSSKRQNAVLNSLFVKNPSKISASSVPSISSKNVVNNVKQQESRLVQIFFGSQTGTAEGFSKDILKFLKTLPDISAKVIDLEDFDFEDFQESIDPKFHAIFITATYGEGDPTDNANNFYQNMKSKGPSNELNGLKFSVFGLGNRQYEKYNAMGRFVKSKMESFGGELFYEYGEGNEDDDIESDFDKWFSGLRKYFNGGVVESTAALAEAKSKDIFHSGFKVTVIEPQPSDDTAAKEKLNNPAKMTSAELKLVDLQVRPYFEARPLELTVKRELRSSKGVDGNGSTLHLEFSLLNSGLEYETADNLAICPENSDNLVSDALTFLNLINLADKWLTIESAPAEEKSLLFPSPTTLKTVFKRYIALNQTPTRHTLKKLAPFATIDAHKQRLFYLASSDGNEEYQKLIVERRRDLVEVFEMFPSISVRSIQPNLASFLEVLPKLTPRYYTISSSNLSSPTSVHITASIVTELKAGLPTFNNQPRVFHGVCTSFLNSMKLGEKIFAYVRKSSFKMPANLRKPIIMVGPGTGVAPMRAFLQERRYLIGNGTVMGPAMLFFGCRNANEDFIYEDELKSFRNEGILDELHVAYSRQTNAKVYVQHLIAQNKESLYDWIETHDAHIYVCGGTLMGKDVHHVFDEIITQSGAARAKNVDNLISNKRYIQELWSA